jgi:hypothetical protein
LKFLEEQTFQIIQNDPTDEFQLKEEYADCKSITLAENFFITEDCEKEQEDEEINITEYIPKGNVEYIEFEVLDCPDENEAAKVENMSTEIDKNLFKDDSADDALEYVEVAENGQASKYFFITNLYHTQKINLKLPQKFTYTYTICHSQ